MTNKVSPDEFREPVGAHRGDGARGGPRPGARSAARSTTTSTSTRTARPALEESKTFLDTYYTSKFTPAFVEGWTVAGSPSPVRRASCAPTSRPALGHMALRLTSWDQRGQLKRFLAEVAPALAGGR